MIRQRPIQVFKAVQKMYQKHPKTSLSTVWSLNCQLDSVSCLAFHPIAARSPHNSCAVESVNPWLPAPLPGTCAAFLGSFHRKHVLPGRKQSIGFDSKSKHRSELHSFSCTSFIDKRFATSFFHLWCVETYPRIMVGTFCPSRTAKK